MGDWEWVRTREWESEVFVLGFNIPTFKPANLLTLLTPHPSPLT